MQLRLPREASVIITTSSPCMHCMKMLLNTEIRLIIYDEEYDLDALDLWVVEAGREADAVHTSERHDD